jgi:hypothetical protein
MKRSALCLVDTEAQADAVVAKLRSAGFSENDISMLFPDKGTTRDFAHKKETKMPEGATVRRASTPLDLFCAVYRKRMRLQWRYTCLGGVT